LAIILRDRTFQLLNNIGYFYENTLMQKLLLIAFVLVLTISCKKNKNEAPDPPPPPTDSLGVGWKRIDAGAQVSISDIFFVGNTGYFLSDRQVYRSTNAGESWQKVHQGNQSLSNIGMGGGAGNAVFVSYSTPMVYFTGNGGSSFDSTTVPFGYFSDVFFVSPTVVYAIGINFCKSVDGGKNWTLVHQANYSSDYKTLHFLNEQAGWILTSKGLAKTINGGVSWDPVATPGFSFNGFGSIFVTDANTIYFYSAGKVGVSRNAGLTWSVVLNTRDVFFEDIHFLTNDIGYLTAGNILYKTTDGGANWKREFKLGRGSLIELHFTDANHGWAAGSEGTILKFEN
jgi:photosystem II stability/assembly factor-like uncharacterized protein